jgi:hypothetical protein
MESYRQRGTISRKVVIWLAIPVVFLFLLVGLRAAMHSRYERTRTYWMQATLPKLAGLSFTNDDIRQEIQSLRESEVQGDHQIWTGDHVLLMTNGECLVYAFYHGFNSGFIDHLFLAHGSDRRWYYSTYHFCNSMAAVMGDEPPGSIAEFSKRYAVREFDGKSDVCLRHTWP